MDGQRHIYPSSTWSVKGPIQAAGPVFCAAAVPGVAASVNLADHGYLEEEFLLEGNAHHYEYGADGQVAVAQAELPYATRLLVRRPVRSADFSGVVHFEPLHPGATFDCVMTFAETWRRILRSGDAWVGMSAKPNAIANLARFNADRYRGLFMKDRSQLWDMLAQVGLMLKSPGSAPVLGGEPARFVYASGWSMTGSMLRTFIADGFHDRARRSSGAHPFDGYVIGISSGEYVYGYAPLNDEYGPDIDTLDNQARRRTVPVDDPRRVMRPPGVPVIELLGESEALNNRRSWRPDSDVPADRFRLYEVPGRGHRAAGPNFAELSEVPMASIGITRQSHPGVTDIDKRPRGGFPSYVVTQAVFENLHRWVAFDVAPPRADPILMGAGSPLRVAADVHGNAIGGLRHPFVDVPVASYTSVCPEDPLRFGPVTAWQEIPLAPEVLTGLYGDQAGYLAAFRRAVNRAVAERRIEQADAGAAIAWAESTSAWAS